MIATCLAPVTIDRAGDEVIYFTSLSTTGPPAWLVLPLIFMLRRGRAWPVRPRWSAGASPSCRR